MRYKLNPKIFYANIILCILLLGTTIYTEGLDVIRTRTETLSCPLESIEPCEYITGQGEEITLQRGEEKTLNQFNQKKLDITNYGVWIMITISLLINHFTQNKGYPIKKELTKLLNKFKTQD